MKISCRVFLSAAFFRPASGGPVLCAQLNTTSQLTDKTRAASVPTYNVTRSLNGIIPSFSSSRHLRRQRRIHGAHAVRQGAAAAAFPTRLKICR